MSWIKLARNALDLTKVATALSYGILTPNQALLRCQQMWEESYPTEH
jgi:hypothetical protein